MGDPSFLVILNILKYIEKAIKRKVKKEKGTSFRRLKHDCLRMARYEQAGARLEKKDFSWNLQIIFAYLLYSSNILC
jgi:hypothetical protein